MIENVKKVKVLTTLLCDDGPIGGFEAGSLFEAPFPDGIARELEFDFKRIVSGKGILEILEEEKPVKEWKKKTS